MSSLNLIDVVIGNANRGPDRPAFVTVNGTMSYGELLERSSQCARFLKRHGVQPGFRVAIAYPRAEDNIVALLAAWRLGATPVLLDFRMKSAERETVAGALGLSALVHTRAGQGKTSVLEIATGNLTDAIAGEATGHLEHPGTDHPALIFRTSGTTGTPQGAVFTHDALLHMHWAKRLGEMGFRRGLFMHATPLYYTAGLERTLSQLFDGGASFVLPTITSMEEMAEHLAAYRAAVAFLVPAQLLAMLDLSEGRSEPMFPGLRLVSGGANVTIEACMRARRELTPDIAVTFGTSLCGAISTLTGEHLPQKAGSVGLPYSTNRVEIFDPAGDPCRRGEPGLVKVRAAGNAHAMLGASPGSSDRIVDGWAETGDLGYIDDDGFLFLVGRSSDLIIRKGVNVFPREIEVVLEAHDDVVEAAVIGVPDPEAGEEIVAFVIVRGGLTGEALRNFARPRLVADKLPKTIRVVDTLPRNAAGKIVKRELAAMIAAEKGGASH